MRTLAVEILILALGLAAGSFLNVCIHRLPRGESVVRPRSYCPNCGHSVSGWDNIPILSFLILLGHCRHCRMRISFRYPVVELVSGLLWLGSWHWSGGASPLFGIRVLFLSILLVVSLTDLETGLIPDIVTLFGMGAGVVLSFVYPPLQFLGSVSDPSSQLWATGKSVGGLLAGGVLIYVTGLIGNWVFKKESMGGGDVKLMAMVGSFLGWERVVATFFMAPFFALPLALYSKWVKKAETIPYGPFLSLAAGILFLFGEPLWRYFLGY